MIYYYRLSCAAAHKAVKKKVKRFKKFNVIM